MDEVVLKKCYSEAGCGEWKPISDFYNYARSKDGKNRRCKACVDRNTKEWRKNNRERFVENRKRWLRENPNKQREYDRKKLYGITAEQYNKLVEDQCGLCSICRDPPKYNQPLHVDHDHISGSVRGLLCNACNASIGHVGESPEVLIEWGKRAAEYIRRYM